MIPAFDFVKEHIGIIAVCMIALLFLLKDQIFKLFKKKPKQVNPEVFKKMQDADNFSLQEKRVLAQRWIDYCVQKAKQIEEQQQLLSAQKEDLRRKYEYYGEKVRWIDGYERAGDRK